MKKALCLLSMIPMLAFAANASNSIYKRVDEKNVQTSTSDTLYMSLEKNSKTFYSKKVDVSNIEVLMRQSFNNFVNSLEKTSLNGNVPLAQRETLEAFKKLQHSPVTIETGISNITKELSIPVEKSKELIQYLKMNLNVPLVWNNVNYGDVGVKYKESKMSNEHSILLKYSDEESVDFKSLFYSPNMVNIEYSFDFLVNNKTKGQCHKTTLNKIYENKEEVDVTATLCHQAKLK